MNAQGYSLVLTENSGLGEMKMFLCIFINDPRVCKSAHDRGKSNREEHRGVGGEGG